MPTEDPNFAIRKEIEAQLIQLEIKIKKADQVTYLVGLLSQKRQLQELLNQYR